MKKKFSIIGLILDLIVFAVGGLVGMLFGVAFWKGFVIGLLTIAIVSILQAFTVILNNKIKK